MRRLMNQRPATAERITLGVLPFIALLIVYVVASRLRLAENPGDKLLPSFAQMGQSIWDYAFTADARSGRFLLWSDTWASLKRIGLALLISSGAGLLLAMAIGVGTPAATLWMLGRKWWASDRRLPVNGVVAYLVTLYAWLLLNVDPLFLLVIPACHSLQYLLVVWRYQLNADRARARDAQASGGRRLTANVAARFASFLLTGLVVGYVGFWGLPRLLGSTLPVDESLFGPTLFVFVCWIFINTHHYFLDNVMWRRGNPDTGRYLFSHR
jgi:hypothetical protein